ncbi:MAG TPA: MBL fold metallo-hydrolase [Stellaceae bacterium]|nr:MBL fold metallo-hydrolase [Stellaceae bacterium]
MAHSLAARCRPLLLLLLWAALLIPGRALAAPCLPNVASRPLQLASLPVSGSTGIVDLTFLGHASFLIESAAGVTIVTDYNGYIRPPFIPDIVTMNHAHPTHYTDHPEPEIKYVLRGWDTGSGPPHWDLRYRDVRIRNVLTNIRDYGYGGTEYGGNSIFVFEIADLCIAHLSHLHHTLTQEHLADLGQIDVLLTPVDGAYTLSQTDMLTVIEQIHPALVVPMHFFGPSVLQRFLDRVGERYPVKTSESPRVALSRAMLPKTTEILVLPGNGF